VSQHLTSVDLVRAFALFGICSVNLSQMGMTDGASLAVPVGTIDQLARLCVATFLEAKSFPVFAFILGWGLAGQWERGRFGGFAPRHLRRCAGLAVLGLLHGVLVYTGDILLPYAILCLVAWPFLAAEPKVLLRIAAGMVALGTIILLLLGFSLRFFAGGGFADEVVPLSGLAGSFADGTLQRLQDLPVDFFSAMLFNGPISLAAMLAGVAAAKARFLEAPDPLARLRELVPLPLRYILVAGLLANFLFGWVVSFVGVESLLAFPAFGAVGIGSPILAGLWLLLLVQLAARWSAPSWLMAAGRNSLSAYVTQGILAGWVFGSYGLGLFGNIGAAGMLGLALIIWFASCIFVAVCERLLGAGPLEHLLRLVTGPRPPARPVPPALPSS
jgi:uncharacterized protein